MSVLAALESSTYLLVAVVFVTSLLVGSFLNVVIHRLPIMLDRAWRRQAEEILSASSAGAAEGADPAADVALATAPETYNLVVPRSACPACGTPIKAWQNVPVVSYLLLRGRCANCQARISPRYPIVEAVTAVLSALVAWRFGATPFMLAALVFTWTLIALTVIDLDHQLLPDGITLPLLWLGLLVAVAALRGTSRFPVDLPSAVVGAAAGYLSLWCVFHAFRLLTGKEGMGFGDFKLFAALGAWLGWQMLPLVILLAAATGAVVGIALIALRGRDRNVPIPFGPFLSAAGWIALMWGPTITGTYLRASGLQ